MNRQTIRLVLLTMLSPLLVATGLLAWDGGASPVCAAEAAPSPQAAAAPGADAETRALRFMEMAVEAGSPRAKRLLGEELIRGERLTKDLDRGEALLEEAARTDVDAQLSLGRMYLTGEGLPQDVTRGTQLLEAAAEAGKSSAAQLLGTAFLTGRDVPFDAGKAEDLLRKAAESGNAEASRNLALALIQGRALQKDADAGMQLLQSSADAGDENAAILLGELLLRGEDVPQDVKRAAGLFEQLAEKGDGGGLQILGENYLWGTFTRRDPKKAEALLSRAGELGRETVWSSLANGAVSERLGRRSAARFDEFAEKARAVGDPRIDVYEAERYLRGSGVPQSSAEAIKLLETAASAGNSRAAAHLIGLYRDGRRKLISRSPKKARAYLEKYAGTFSESERGLQGFLLEVAAARSKAAFEKLLATPEYGHYLSDRLAQDDILQANANFAVYRVQKVLQSRELYDGPLDGLLKRATIRGMQEACRVLAIGARCQQRVLTSRIIGRLTHGWHFSAEYY